MVLIHSIPGSPTQRARWGLGQCYTSSELTTEIFQIKLADSWVLAGWCWAGWWLGNYPGEMLRLLTLISPLTADNGLLSFDQRNLVNIQHSLTVIKTVITSDQAFSDGLSELHSDRTDLACLQLGTADRGMEVDD